MSSRSLLFDVSVKADNVIGSLEKCHSSFQALGFYKTPQLGCVVELCTQVCKGHYSCFRYIIHVYVTLSTDMCYTHHITICASACFI